MEPYQDLGNELRYECPLCHSENNKFYIQAAQGVWSCFNCGHQGNLTKLISEVRHVSFTEAKAILEELDEYVDEDFLEEITTDTLLDHLLELGNEKEKAEKVQLHMPRMPTNAKRLVENMNNPEALPFFQYLNKRGVQYQDIVNADIHYVKQGIFKANDGRELNLSNSILFITYLNGKPAYWSSRSIDPNPWIKSINAPAQEGEYSRREVVYGINQVDGRSLVLCEGIFNAFTVTNNHYLGLATLGKQVTDEQIALILSVRDKFDKLYLFLDTDAHKEEFKLITRFVDAGLAENDIAIVLNPFANQDANDLGRKLAIKLVEEDSAQPSLKTMLKLLEN
nr:CHC2 zinc finger domain-containing protein [Secundilactobacillus kimchicus]